MSFGSKQRKNNFCLSTVILIVHQNEALSTTIVAPKSLRKPSGKKVGGQNGHKETHLAVTTVPDEIVKYMPLACEGCWHYQMCKGTACIVLTEFQGIDIFFVNNVFRLLYRLIRNTNLIYVGIDFSNIIFNII